MSKSYFERDMKNEQILTKWIVNNFISLETEKYEVIEDTKTQNTGVDFVMTSEDIFGYSLPYKVDFKAALNYIRPMLDNKNIQPQKMPTFAFELSFLNKSGKEREGWLFGEKYNNTEYYMLAWIWVDLPYKYNKSGYIEIDIDKFTYESIKEVEVMIINKEVLRNYSRKYKIDEVSAITQSKEMRSNRTKEAFLVNDNRFPKLHYSSFLKEQPVNLVIHTKELEKMAVFHKTITQLPSDINFEAKTENNLSSIEYSCKLFNSGYKVNEIMVMRGLTHSTVLDHLYNGALDNLVNPISSFLTKDKRTSIHQAIQQNGDGKLSSIKNYLDEELGIDAISYNEIKQYFIEVYSNR